MTVNLSSSASFLLPCPWRQWCWSVAYCPHKKQVSKPFWMMLYLLAIFQPLRHKLPLIEGSRGQRGEEALPSWVWRTELHDREHRQSLEARKGKNTNGKVASSAGLGTGFRLLLSRTERVHIGLLSSTVPLVCCFRFDRKRVHCCIGWVTQPGPWNCRPHK